MRIPEVRARLREIANETGNEELDRLADELVRRPPVTAAPVKSRKMTDTLRQQIVQYHQTYPALTQVEIGAAFGVNPGRVSEALAGFRS